MPNSARFLAFSDGSSIANPGGPGATGYVVYDRSNAGLRFGAKRYVEDGLHPVTNNRMELRAVLEALEEIPTGASVLLLSDSQYAVNALTKWIHGWRRKGWRTADGKGVLNRDLIEAIDQRARKLEMRFEWIRGHHGHPVNEVVDALAQSAARGVPGPTRDDVINALQKELSGTAAARR